MGIKFMVGTIRTCSLYIRKIESKPFTHLPLILNVQLYLIIVKVLYIQYKNGDYFYIVFF